jgi:hypothetical protein
MMQPQQLMIRRHGQRPRPPAPPAAPTISGHELWKDTPYWYYQEVVFGTGNETFFKQVKVGYDYLLTGILCSIPQDHRGGDIGADVYFQVTQPERGIGLFDAPIPLTLAGSPGQTRPAAGPGTRGRDVARTWYYPIRYLFLETGVIRVDCTRPPGVLEPISARLVLVGRNLFRGRQ